MNIPDITMNRLEIIWDDLENDPDTNWDDLYEHQPEDLQMKFDLDEQDASILWMNIQSLCDSRRNVGSFRPSTVGHMINEAVHQGLDAWTIGQGMVIKAFLSDIAWACWQIQEDERKAKLRGHDRGHD